MVTLQNSRWSRLTLMLHCGASHSHVVVLARSLIYWKSRVGACALQRVDKVHKIGASVTLYWHKIELSGLLTVSFTIYNTERNTEQVGGFFFFFHKCF